MNDKELETFVGLKYFPLSGVEVDDLIHLPREVLDKMDNSITGNVLSMIRGVTLSPETNDKFLRQLEEVIFKLCMDYHKRYGWDYDEHGEIPTYE